MKPQMIPDEHRAGEAKPCRNYRRESIAAEATDTFLSKSGKELERELLLKQRSALEQEQHMAKVMIAIETAEERRAFWCQVEKRFTELRGDVDALLRRNYFCA